MTTRYAVRPGSIIVSVGRALVWVLVGSNLVILLLTLVSSIKQSSAILQTPWTVPTRPYWENWINAFSKAGFGRAAVISIVLVGLCSLIIIVVAAPAAYLLARVSSRGYSALTFYFVLGMGIPAQVIVLPVYVMMSRIGLSNSLIGLAIVYVAVSLPFSVFLLTGFFRSLPSEIAESATVDGASAAVVFVRIMLPLARSGLITVFILNAVSLWNETLLALILLQNTAIFPLQIEVLSFYSSFQYQGADYGLLFAGLCFLVLPMLVVYVLLGRRIVEGMTLGIGK